MRSPLHVRATAVAATMALCLLLVVNILTGEHAPLSAPVAQADFSSMSSASTGNASSLFSPQFTTAWHSGTAAQTVVVGTSSNSSADDGLCFKALANAKDAAYKELDEDCTALAMFPAPLVTYYTDYHNPMPSVNSGDLVYTQPQYRACDLTITESGTTAYTKSYTGYAAIWGTCTEGH